ncbi:MAG: hypothetical protein U9Q85_00670 [Patescibacteria group bacterium]|nr:hypothetical protein [Patescibacteria group bacterium]
MKINIKIRILLFSILLIIIFCLLYLSVVPFGNIAYTQNFRADNYFISKISPAERVISESGGIKIIGDPVYFNLCTSRNFDKATITYKFKTNIDKAIIESGPLVDKTIWQYKLKPIYNSIIDNLFLNGHVLEQEGNLFWQKEKKYSSLEDFLVSKPNLDELAFYHYDWPHDFILPDYATSSAKQVINYPLRGAYQFYTYIKDELLDFSFDFSDLNQNSDKDKIELFLLYDNEVINSRLLDDIKTQENKEVEGRGQVNFKIFSLPEGLYKIELRANNDIVTKSIETRQNKLSFINKVELLRDDNTDIKIYTNSNQIQATTIYPDRLQTIKTANGDFEIKTTYQQHQFDVLASNASSSISELILEKDGLKISGNGVFAFAEQALLNPTLKKLDRNLDINSINYLLAEYKNAEQTGNWKMVSQNFDLTQVYCEDNTYQFIISIPGLRADAGVDDYVEIKKIKVELSGKSLLEKIIN